MYIIREAEVTDANHTTNATEASSPWNSGTGYSDGQRATKGKRIWESAQNANTNHDPETDDGTWWIEIGPTNAWAMFDEKTGTQTVRASDLTVTIEPGGRIDTVALLNIDAAEVEITVTEGVDEVFNETFSLVSTDGISDWWAWFFEPIERRTDLYVSGLPNVLAPEVTIAATGSGDIAIGKCVVGYSRELGATQYGLRLGIADYSRMDEDDFGNWFFVRRGYAKTMSLIAWVEEGDLDYVFNLLASVRATPVVVIGSELYSSTLQFGIFKNWNIEIAYPTHFLLSVDFQGI